MCSCLLVEASKSLNAITALNAGSIRSLLADTDTKKLWTSECLYLRSWPYCVCFKRQVGMAFGSIQLGENSERLGRMLRRAAASFLAAPPIYSIAFAERMAGWEVVLMFLPGMARIICLSRPSGGARARSAGFNVNGLKRR